MSKAEVVLDHAQTSNLKPILIRLVTVENGMKLKETKSSHGRQDKNVEPKSSKQMKKVAQIFILEHGFQLFLILEYLDRFQIVEPIHHQKPASSKWKTVKRNIHGLFWLLIMKTGVWCICVVSRLAKDLSTASICRSVIDMGRESMLILNQLMLRLELNFQILISLVGPCIIQAKKTARENGESGIDICNLFRI